MMVWLGGGRGRHEMEKGTRMEVGVISGVDGWLR